MARRRGGVSASPGDMASFIPTRPSAARALAWSWRVLAPAEGTLGNGTLTARGSRPHSLPAAVPWSQASQHVPATGCLLATRVASLRRAKSAKPWHCLGVTTGLKTGGCGVSLGSRGFHHHPDGRLGPCLSRTGLQLPTKKRQKNQSADGEAAGDGVLSIGTAPNSADTPPPGPRNISARLGNKNRFDPPRQQAGSRHYESS